MGKKKIGTIAWHTEQIEKIRARNRYVPKKKEKEGVKDIPRRKKQKADVKYDFLMYIRIVMRWAVTNSNLNRRELEMLLYLYGLGTFSKRQFHDFHKTMGMYEQKTLSILTEKGHIMLWRPANRKTKEHALYTLTHGSKLLCSRVHRICCGLDTIPVEEISNKLAGDTGKRIDGYYMAMIKKMNREKTTPE